MIRDLIAWLTRAPFGNYKLHFNAVLGAFVIVAPAASVPALERYANFTLNMPQNPEAGQATYTIRHIMPHLQFEKPVNFAVEPGETNRLYVVERTGRIAMITNLASPTRTVFMDITDRVYSDYELGFCEGLSSLVFHPGYATNRYFFVTYTTRTNIGGQWVNFNRISRFQRSPTNRDQGLADSEAVMIHQLDEGAGHNLNDLHFGADGYLYCAAGDEGDGATGGDEYNNAQRIDGDFFSAILRLDVDMRAGSLSPNPHPASLGHYAIPPDNPFVGATSFNGSPLNPANVRTEFYAVGFRNVWRMSFDPVTGFLYAGDVGQWDREEINVVVKGGNYGWAYRQGSVVGPKGEPPAGVNLIPPIAEVPHGWGVNEGFAIMGGVVYRGDRMPQLHGAYVFSDYVTGNIWSLRYDGASATPYAKIAFGNFAGFGVDPRNGDVLMADHTGGGIFILDYASIAPGNLPQTLADTGAFSDLETLMPHAGIVPYDINVPFWSDKATKRRWFSVPDPSLKIGFSADGNWTFPDTTVWIKHFELEMTNGVPESARRLETRLLVKNPSGVYGATYRWGDSTSNAMLVPEQGLDEAFVIHDSGIIRTQVWRYPSRNECLSCHTVVAGHALGFNTHQLNRDFNHGSPTNQIAALSAAGYFDVPPTNVFLLRALTHATNAAYSREYRVRSFLAANCVQCHQPGGPAGGFWDARISTPISVANIINGSLMNNLGDSNNRVIEPASTGYSMILTRLLSTNGLRMPPIGSRLQNTEAIQLITDWIVQDLADYQSFWTWQNAHFGSASLPEAAPDYDADLDGNPNYMEYLLRSNPMDPNDRWAMAVQVSSGTTHVAYVHHANRGFEVQTTTNLDPPVEWKPLNDPSNRLFFPATTQTNVISQPLSGSANRYFRARIIEP